MDKDILAVGLTFAGPRYEILFADKVTGGDGPLPARNGTATLCQSAFDDQVATFLNKDVASGSKATTARTGPPARAALPTGPAAATDATCAAGTARTPAAREGRINGGNNESETNMV